jgi:VanZ family protein
VLAASAVQLFKRASLPWVAAGLVLLGIGIEFAQGQTVYRSADLYDVLFNALGVALGMATALTPWRDLLLRIEKRSGP